MPLYAKSVQFFFFATVFFIPRCWPEFHFVDALACVLIADLLLYSSEVSIEEQT